VTTSPGTSLYNLYTENDIGYIVEPDNHVFLSKLISDLDTDGNNEQKRKNAREYAVNHLNIDNVMSEFIGKVLI
jgi:colanic acid biosynthesis glycosyl transferase WcaI